MLWRDSNINLDCMWLSWLKPLFPRKTSPTGRIFLEALSDILVADRGLVCIQVKRTLTRASIVSAAEEVAAIEQFLVARHPDIRQTVRYHLVAARGDEYLKWDDVPTTHAAHRLIESLLRDGRLLPPVIEPDPGWRAVAAVWSHVDDPYGFIRYAVDRALDRDVSPANAERVRDDICERFARERRKPNILGQLLTPVDFRSVDKPSSTLDIGREVTLARMRDQQYMERPRRRDGLSQSLVLRYELAQQDLEPAARVFWITGRSGVGKSVLLLQAMKHLVEQGRRVLWLGGSPELLEGTLRAVASAPEDLRPEFIAVDDLYDRDARTRIDLQRLGAFIDEFGSRSWPLVVTCGPAEFAETFEEDSRYRGFLLHRESIHPVASDEADQIAVWYQARTGRKPAVGAAFAQVRQADGGLFVSLAIELAHGDLREFALRFAQRLEVNGLHSALRLPLALNRIYVRFPYAWLAPTDREKLASLNQDGDFKVLDEGVEGQVVRLTHPHLADAIYRASRRPGNAEAYTNDLVDAFARTLAEGNHPLAMELLRFFSGPRTGIAGQRLTIVDEERLAEACARVWQQYAAAMATDSDAVCDFATSWACWSVRQPAINRSLGAQLFETAAASLDASVKLWPACWQRLNACFPHSTALKVWAARELPVAERMAHAAWAFVWARCFVDAPNDVERWRDLGLNWLRQNLRRPNWHFVWKKLLPRNPALYEHDASVEMGERRLTLEKDGADWAYVLEDLLRISGRSPERSASLVTLGLKWLEGREERAEWTYVWRALVHAPHLPHNVHRVSLLRHGWQWMHDRENSSGWPYMLQELLNHSDQLPNELTPATLCVAGAAWMPRREDHLGWGVTWRSLLENAAYLPNDLDVPKLLATGLEWLRGRQDSPGWTHVWRAMADHFSALSAEMRHSLLQLGNEWIVEGRGQPGWIFVWQGLCKAKHDVPADVHLADLHEIGWSWLATDPEENHWSIVWWELGKENAASLSPNQRQILFAPAVKWLSDAENLELSDASRFIEGLLELGCTEPSFQDSAACWLRAATEKPNWPIIAAKFLAAFPKHEAAPHIAFELRCRIQAHPNHRNWKKIGHLIDSLDCDTLDSSEPLKALHDAYHNRTTSPAWQLLDTRLQSSHPVIGTVTHVEPLFCVVQLQIGLIATWFWSEESEAPLLGSKDFYYVCSFSRSSGFVYVSKAMPVLLSSGAITRGVVQGHSESGLYVRVPPFRGLIHRSRCRHFDDVVCRHPTGSGIEVQVMQHLTNRLELLPADPDEVALNYSDKRSLNDTPRAIGGDHVVAAGADELHGQSTIDVGAVYSAQISGTAEYGLFFRIGGLSGLLHRSKCVDFDRVLSEHPIGSVIDIRVLSTSSKGISGATIDWVEPLRIDKSDINVGQEFNAVVRNSANFGVFLDIAGHVALLHRNELARSSRFVKFTKGDVVRVRVISRKGDKIGVALSI